MNGFHPKAARVVACALAAGMLAGGGCKSTSSGVNNPFLAPDRVAPPSTRALAPGQAQPYYPGDSLPVMQSATAPPTNNVASGAGGTDTLSSTGRTLAWNAPAGTTPVSTLPPGAQATDSTTSPWEPAPKTPPAIAYGNEQPIAVPTDANELRFALPAPVNAEPAMPIAEAAPPIQQRNPMAITPQPSRDQNIALASYNAPATVGLSPAPSSPELMQTSQPVSPWRSPYMGQIASQPPMTPPLYGMQASPYQAVVVQPAAPPTATNKMAVQLRSVPAPPPQPGDPMPRIRFPGYEVPQTATADGFRPRTAMR